MRHNQSTATVTTVVAACHADGAGPSSEQALLEGAEPEPEDFGLPPEGKRNTLQHAAGVLLSANVDKGSRWVVVVEGCINKQLCFLGTNDSLALHNERYALG